MRAILEFSLPEESTDHQLALDGRKWYLLVSDLSRFLRDKAKYGDSDVIKIDEVRQKLAELLNEDNLNLDY